MNKREAKAAIEALLFIMGDAVDAAALAAACETDEEMPSETGPAEGGHSSHQEDSIPDAWQMKPFSFSGKKSPRNYEMAVR